MSDYPKFPDSKKKAPNVFFGVYDDGTLIIRPQDAGPHPKVYTAKVRPKYFTSVIYPEEMHDRLSVANAAILYGELEFVAIYFTSVLYPFIEEDFLGVRVPSITDSNLIMMPTPHDDVLLNVPPLTRGALITTIAYPTYTWGPELLNVTVPTLITGALNTVIFFLNYRNWEIEYVSVALPTIVAGALI